LKDQKKKKKEEKEEEENQNAEEVSDEDGEDNEDGSESGSDSEPIDSENKEYEQVIKRRTKRLVRINIVMYLIFSFCCCFFCAWYIADVLLMATGTLYANSGNIIIIYLGCQPLPFPGLSS
jgi:hypothetical protein